MISKDSLLSKYKGRRHPLPVSRFPTLYPHSKMRGFIFSALFTLAAARAWGPPHGSSESWGAQPWEGNNGNHGENGIPASSAVAASTSAAATSTASANLASATASCISAADASIVATDFGLLISNYTEALAVQLLAGNFTDQSDSVNTLIYEPGLLASNVSSFLPYLPLPPPSILPSTYPTPSHKPQRITSLTLQKQLGSLTFSSKAAFLAGQGAQPNVPFAILNLWNTCDAVIIRWISRQLPLPVQGISIAEVQPAIAGQGGGVGSGAQKWQIKAVLAEFNSGAWLGDLGYPECAVVANRTATAAAAK